MSIPLIRNREKVVSRRSFSYAFEYRKGPEKIYVEVWAAAAPTEHMFVRIFFANAL